MRFLSTVAGRLVIAAYACVFLAGFTAGLDSGTALRAYTILIFLSACLVWNGGLIGFQTHMLQFSCVAALFPFALYTIYLLIQWSRDYNPSIGTALGATGIALALVAIIPWPGGAKTAS